MRTAAYLRVSTIGQNETGQRREIERWLKGNGTEGVRWFIDHDTGDNLNRPGFEQMQRDIFMGEIDAVVVYKLDRLSRSLRDGINTLCDWLDRGVRLVATSQGHDFAGPVGKLVASVLFSIAEMEQQTRRERQAAGIAVAKERGVYRGRRAGTTKARPARARQLRQQGYAVAEIANALKISKRTALRYLGQGAVLKNQLSNSDL